MKNITAESYNFIRLHSSLRTQHSYHIHKKPTLRNGRCIEEKRSSDIGFRQKVVCEVCNVFEEGKPSAGLEHKKSNSLLKEKADYHGRPCNSNQQMQWAEKEAPTSKSPIYL